MNSNKLVTQADLVKYYFLYKDLALLHRSLGFGNAPRSSEGFTESICRALFGFERSSGVNREYDLIDSRRSLRIEVKATTTTDGTTTINPNSVFDHLYWVILLLDQDAIQIKKIEYSELRGYLASQNKEKRVVVALKDYKNSDMGLFRFSKETQSIISVTVEEQVEYIKSIFPSAGHPDGTSHAPPQQATANATERR